MLAMSRGTPSGTFVGTSLQSVDPNMAITLHELCEVSPDDGSDPAESGVVVVGGSSVKAKAQEQQKAPINLRSTPLRKFVFYNPYFTK